MYDSSARQIGAELRWPLSLTSSWTQFSSLSPSLIWSMSAHCWQKGSSTVLPHVCAYAVSSPSLPLIITGKDQQFSLYLCSTSMCAVMTCVSMNCQTTSCVYFSAPPAPQEIPELHLSVPESWNLLPEVVCQDKSFLPPAHSRWAEVQSTQSLASSCESRQWYCQSSCWR